MEAPHGRIDQAEHATQVRGIDAAHSYGMTHALRELPVGSPAMARAMRRQCPALWRVILLLLLLSQILRPRTASAHANLVQSDPPAQASLARAPAQVQLIFSEAVEPRAIEVSVIDRDRRRVDRADVRLADGTNDTAVESLADLPPGVYTIVWKVASAVDGHVTSGRVPFQIGDPGVAPEPLSGDQIGGATSATSGLQSGAVGAIARWLTLLSMLALGGSFAAGPLLLQPALHRLRSISQAEPDAAAAPETVAAFATDTARRLVRLIWLALALFAFGSVALLLVDAAAAGDVSLLGAFGSPLADQLRSRRGLEWLARSALAFFLAAGVALRLITSRPKRQERRAGRLFWWLAVAVVAAMLLLTSVGSHSASVGNGALGVVADWVHLAAASLWIGGLLFFGLVLLPAMRLLDGPTRTRLLAFMVPRFSVLAMVSVGAILLTGVFQTYRLLDHLSLLTQITWGRTLLLKLLTVGVLLTLGLFNLAIVKPRMLRYAAKMDEPSRREAAALRGRFRQVVQAEVGLGVLILLLAGALTGVSPSVAKPAMPDGPFRPFTLDAGAEDLSGRLVLSPGRIGVNRFDLSVRDRSGRGASGAMTAVLRITALDQESGTTEAPLQPLGGGRFTGSGSYLSTVGLWEVAAVIRRAGRDDVSLPFRLSLTDSTGRSEAETPRAAAPIARGRELFQQNCVQCHGAGARGDGPLAASLSPPPLDLTVHVPLHTDAELAGWISNGIARTAMPAFSGQVAPEEIQAVINYLREVAKKSVQDR